MWECFNDINPYSNRNLDLPAIGDGSNWGDPAVYRDRATVGTISSFVRGGVYNESVSISVSGSPTAGPITFENYPGQSATDHCTIANNTLFQNDTKNTGSGEFQIQYYATNNVFKNNIVYASSQGLFINNYTNSEANPADVDYNLYYSSASSSIAKFLWNGTNYTGFSSYQSATGKDSHSQYADPQFLSLTTPDLHIPPTSPAVDAGINLGPAVVGTLDFAGHPRVLGTTIDIGAYEQ